MTSPTRRPIGTHGRLPEPVDPHPDDRGPWLVYATAGPALTVAAVVGPAVADVTARADAFDAALARQRPRLVIAAVPPARPAELARLTEARRRRPGLRIVLLDEPDAADERLGALRAGFDEALPSSIGPDELLGRVRLLLARRGEAHQPTGPRRRAVAPGVVLDLTAHDVRRDGRVVHLRPKEFALLALLATHPGRAYDRDDLLRLVWGPDRRSDRRTVDVHVRWLRAKIEPDPSRPAHIVTVRGVGYRLDPVPLTEP